MYEIEVAVKEHFCAMHQLAICMRSLPHARLNRRSLERRGSGRSERRSLFCKRVHRGPEGCG